MSKTKEIEIFKDIEGYEGLYQISNYGNVKSLNYHCTGKEKILKQGKDKYGYLFVNLYKDGKRKKFLSHRLVVTTFISNDNPTEKIQVNHIDENKENNHVSNLEWVTPKENINWGTRNERASKNISKAMKGKNNPMYGKKHTEESKQKMRIPILQYTLDGEFLKEFDSTTQASTELNIDSGNITQCCRKKRKTCGGFIWRYKE